MPYKVVTITVSAVNPDAEYSEKLSAIERDHQGYEPLKLVHVGDAIGQVAVAGKPRRQARTFVFWYPRR